MELDNTVIPLVAKIMQLPTPGDNSVSGDSA